MNGYSFGVALAWIDLVQPDPTSRLVVPDTLAGGTYTQHIDKRTTALLF